MGLLSEKCFEHTFCVRLIIVKNVRLIYSEKKDFKEFSHFYLGSFNPFFVNACKYRILEKN
uniref:Uncharacterized protein n=1 Tax=Promethearchaeum syntrophicum TaxID=2594042 RepID=A0A5B9D8J7_9ARCH|nr:hypothetical protein DSAG12_01218 [Candidatus Prometheoarchaeum syntrophicum]